MTINVSSTLQKSKRGAILTISAEDLASMHSNKTKKTTAKSVASSSDDGNDHSKPIFPASDWESDANTNNLNDTEASEARSIRSFLIKQTFITSTVQFLVSLTFFQCVPFFHIIHKTIHLFSPKQMKLKKLKNIPNVNAAQSAPPSSPQQLSICKLLLGREAPPQLKLASEPDALQELMALDHSKV